MNPAQINFALLLLLLPSMARAQDVRVGLYTLHPPIQMSVIASAGTLRWRSCAMCPENSVKRLSLEAAGVEVRIHDAGMSKDVYVSGPYRIESSGLPAVAIHFPLHVEAREGHLILTVALRIEDYVAAVLVGESGDFKNDEAIKAMAVAVRTYAARFRGQHGDDGFDFCDTTHCQVPSWNDVPTRFRVAVDATRSEVVWFNGAPAATHYHQNCGGTLAASNEAWPAVSEPYLRSHPDPYCSSAAPLQWESSISIADLDAALHSVQLSPPSGWTTVEVVSRSASGRAQRLRLTGGAHSDAVISASSFRFAVDRALGWNKIRSDLYEIRIAGDHIIFSGRGSGHGVGLCQAGAEEMAREGKDYRQILSFYYPGTELKKAAADPWQKRSTENFELLSTAPEEDSSLLPLAKSILKQNEASIGWKLSFQVRLQVFPTLDRYRDTTGQPGWVAATTRGHTVRLQPLAVLRQKSILESTLRHELFHLLIESHANADTPLWFREGLVLWLSEPDKANSMGSGMMEDEVETILRQPNNREQLEMAYSAARARVASLMQENGKEVVLGWLSGGIPGSALRNPAPAPDHGASQHPGKQRQ